MDFTWLTEIQLAYLLEGLTLWLLLVLKVVFTQAFLYKLHILRICSLFSLAFERMIMKELLF